MMKLILKLCAVGLVVSCASFHGDVGQGVTRYEPAALGPQMDLHSIRADAMNRLH